jgi:hypothetical protein
VDLSGSEKDTVTGFSEHCSELSDSVSVGNFLTGSVIIICLKSLLRAVACYMFTQPTEVLLNIYNTCTNCDMKNSPHVLEPVGCQYINIPNRNPTLNVTVCSGVSRTDRQQML